MVDLTTASKLLRGLRRDVAESENDAFAIQIAGSQFFVRNEEFQAYLERKPAIRQTGETQLFYPGYYEHVVQFEGTALRRPSRRGSDDALRIEAADGKTAIEIGRPSTMFVLNLTDNDDFGRELRRLLGFSFSRENPPAPRPISEAFRLYTIRVSTQEDSSIGRNESRLHDLAEAAIFHFAYGKGLPITFTKSWERTYYWVGRKETETVQFPLRTYNNELVSYYNLALASDSLVLGYLALYKILEYFYTHVTEQALHQKIKDHLVAPDFAHTKTKKLRELVKLIRNFDTRADELGALQLVLTAYFEKSDLKDWIENYEHKNGTYFTTDVEVMNTKTRVDVSENTIIPNIAKRIYMIRNALVHNKEGEIARFIPYSGQEEALSKEVQILTYLAEQLIVKTGKDIA